MRIAVITTHPIQYYAPFLTLLAKEPTITLKVFYTWSQSKKGVNYDVDFGKKFEWDIPLLEGYDYEFVNNIATDPGIHHFNGLINRDLIPKIKEWKADFLLVIGWNFKSHLSAMRFFKGRIPVIFKGDSTLLDERPGIKRVLRRIFLRWVYSFVDYALYVGANNHDYFYKHGLKEKQLYWIPHAVDNQRFYGPKTYNQEAMNWRKELGLQEGDLTVLFAGKLQIQKDPDFMIRLSNNLPDPRLKIVIVGNGVLEGGLKNAASLDKRIIFLDFQNQQKMPLVYRLGDIFILPSVSETWGLAVNEAMACGLPVIVSSQVGSAKDLVDENINGWIFNPGEQGDRKIKELLDIILNDRSMIKEMGKRSWQKLQNYSYPVAVNKMRLFFEKIYMQKTS